MYCRVEEGKRELEHETETESVGVGGELLAIVGVSSSSIPHASEFILSSTVTIVIRAKS
jgi:hypothetical protein